MRYILESAQIGSPDTKKKRAKWLEDYISLPSHIATYDEREALLKKKIVDTPLFIEKDVSYILR